MHGPFYPRHLNRAREILKNYGSLVGNMGQLRTNVAHLIAAALAEGERKAKEKEDDSDE